MCKIKIFIILRLQKLCKNKKPEDSYTKSVFTIMHHHNILQTSGAVINVYILHVFK